MKVLVSALEPSSNLHLKELLTHTHNIELLGIFDQSLGKPLYDVSEMAIMGVVDALKKLRWFFKVADEMVALAEEADKILLMDSSGFNLPLAKKLKKAYPDKEIIYYILPQIWASRAYRAKQIEASCDRLLGILPFEVDYYSRKAEYVGHPLLDEISLAKETITDNGVIAYMPGSRRSEISRLLPIYKAIQSMLHDKRSVLIIPSSFSEAKIMALYGDISMFEISRDTHATLYEADYAFICSGTATLEAALIGTPFSLSYIAKKLDYFIGKRILNIEYVGLANILLSHYNGTLLHKEFLQEEVTVENLLNEYYHHDAQTFVKQRQALKQYLKQGSSHQVAQILSN
ncbi:MAG TPA: lipid-A-disaccharide synthase [Campylobacterales bacterium]|nr:lipid-A-disaccharide synthase [Campylobacterales bacterium]